MSSSEVESLQIFIRLIDSLRRNLIIFSQGSFEHYDDIRKIDKILIGILRKRLKNINSVLINHLQYLVEIQINFVIIPRSDFWATEQFLVQLESLKVLKEIVRLCSCDKNLQKFCVKLMAREKSVPHLCSFLEMTQHVQSQIEISEIFFYYIHRNPIAKLAFVMDEALPLVVKVFEFSPEKIELRKILIGIIREFCIAYPLQLLKENITETLIQIIDSNYNDRKRRKKGSRESEKYSFLDEYIPSSKRETESDFYLKTICCECLQSLLRNHKLTLQRINVPELAELLLENLTRENDSLGIFTPSLIGSVLPPSKDSAPRNPSKLLFVESVVKLLETLFTLPDDRNFVFNFHKIEGWKGFLHLVNLYLPLFSSAKKSVGLKKRVISLLSLLMRALRIFLMSVHYRMCFEYDLVMDKPSFAILLKSVFQATQGDDENNNNNETNEKKQETTKRRRRKGKKRGKKNVAAAKKIRKKTLPSNDPDLILFQVELSLVFGLIFSKNPFCRYHVKQEMSQYPIWGYTLKRHLLRFLQLAEVEYFADIKVVDALGADLVREVKKRIMKKNQGLRNLKSMLNGVFGEQEDRFIKGQEKDEEVEYVGEEEEEENLRKKQKEEEEEEFFNRGRGGRMNRSGGPYHSQLFVFDEEEERSSQQAGGEAPADLPSPIRPSLDMPAGQIWPGEEEGFPKTPTLLRTSAGDKLLISGKITHSVLSHGIYSCFSSSSSRRGDHDNSLELNSSGDSETTASTNTSRSVTESTRTTPERRRKEEMLQEQHVINVRRRRREERKARVRAKKEQKRRQKEFLEDGLYLLKIFSKYYEGGYQQMQHQRRVMFDDEYMGEAPTAINQSRKFWNEKHMKSQRDLFVFRISFVSKEVFYVTRRLRAFKKRMKRYLVTCPTKDKLRRSFLYDMNQNAIPALEQLFKELAHFARRHGQEGLDRVRKMWVQSGQREDEGFREEEEQEGEQDEEEEEEEKKARREKPLLVDDDEDDDDERSSKNAPYISNRNIIEVLQLISNQFSDEESVEDELMEQLKGEVQETVSTGASVSSFGKQEEEMMMSSYAPQPSPKVLRQLREKENDILEEDDGPGVGKARASQKAAVDDLRKDLNRIDRDIKKMIGGIEKDFK